MERKNYWIIITGKSNMQKKTAGDFREECLRKECDYIIMVKERSITYPVYVKENAFLKTKEKYENRKTVEIMEILNVRKIEE